MAIVFQVRVDTRANCLADFARSLGTYCPRDPIPSWWDAFDRWFAEQHARAEAIDTTPEGEQPTVLVRTEGFTYEEDDALLRAAEAIVEIQQLEKDEQ